MNKKKVIITTALIAIVAISIVIWSISPVNEDVLSGSFSKAEKYREGNADNSHIALRSDFINDTTKLKNAISQLIQFGKFTVQLNTLIDQSWETALNNLSGCTCQKDILKMLDDYKAFLSNNQKTITETVKSISDIYINREKAKDKDIEAQIKQFYNFVNQFLQRDSIFEQTIREIDEAVTTEKLKKKEIIALQNLRDRIVVDNFVYATSIADTSKMAYSMRQKINNPDNMKIIIDNSATMNQAYQVQLYDFYESIEQTNFVDIVENVTNYGSGNQPMSLTIELGNSIIKVNVPGNIVSSSFGFYNQVNSVVANSDLIVGSALDNTFANYINNEYIGCALNKTDLNFVIGNQDNFDNFVNKSAMGLFIVNQSAFGSF